MGALQVKVLETTTEEDLATRRRFHVLDQRPS